MKRTVCCLVLLGACLATRAADKVDDLPFNAIQEKKNVDVKVLDAAVAELGEAGGEINGVHGATADFQGQRLPLWALFTAPLAEDRVLVLARRQGRLQGILHCARVRVGSSPHFPQIRRGVLAQQCEIRTLQ